MRGKIEDWTSRGLVPKLRAVGAFPPSPLRARINNTIKFYDGVRLNEVVEVGVRENNSFIKLAPMFRGPYSMKRRGFFIRSFRIFNENTIEC